MKTIIIFLFLIIQLPDSTYTLKWIDKDPGIVIVNDTAYYDNVFLFNNVDTIYLEKVND